MFICVYSLTLIYLSECSEEIPQDDSYILLECLLMAVTLVVIFYLVVFDSQRGNIKDNSCIFTGMFVDGCTVDVISYLNVFDD
jgi:hypothetical protein